MIFRNQGLKFNFIKNKSDAWTKYKDISMGHNVEWVVNIVAAIAIHATKLDTM